MKLVRLLLSTIFSAGIVMAFAVNEPFIYINPVPSSTLHKNATGIILRAGEQINPATITKSGLFTIIGSLSKGHSVKVALSEDGKSILLQPLTPFVAGDSVVVIYGNGIKTVSGKKITSGRFYFKTTPSGTEPGPQLQVSPGIMDGEGIGNSKDLSAPNTAVESFWTKGIPPLYIWSNTGNSAPGSIFFSNFNFFNEPTEHYCIIDNAGDSIFGKYDTSNYNNFYLNHDGHFTLYNAVDSDYVELDSNYHAIDTFQMGNGYKADVHEFQLFSNKYHWMLAYDPEPVDMSQIVVGGKKTAKPIGCIIQELDDSNRVIFEWRSWDHYNLTDVTHEPLTSTEPDVVHGNSIEVDNDGNILFSARHLEEITKIDVNTGNIIWRLGGKNNQFKFTNDTIGFSYQHDVRRIANGHITVFDNGNYHSPPATYVKEYALDETAKTATLTWSYHRFNPASEHSYSHAMGSVQRLSDGHTFIDWGYIVTGAYPSITEVDSLGNIIWEMRLDSEYYDGIYRAHRVVWNPCSRVTFSTMAASKITATAANLSWLPATNAVSYSVEYRPVGTGTFKTQNLMKTTLKLKNLSPSTTYQWGVRSTCQTQGSSNFTALATFTTLSARDMSLNEDGLDATIYPNPSHGIFSLQIDAPDNNPVSVVILDASSRIMYQNSFGLSAGSNITSIDLSKLNAGVYFCQIKSGSNQIIKKIVIE